MKKEVLNQIKSFQVLFNETMNPVFMTALMYVRRTGKTITLDGIRLEKEDGLTL